LKSHNHDNERNFQHSGVKFVDIVLFRRSYMSSGVAEVTSHAAKHRSVTMHKEGQGKVRTPHGSKLYQQKSEKTTRYFFTGTGKHRPKISAEKQYQAELHHTSCCL
jgi:hypothetical protein